MNYNNSKDPKANGKKIVLLVVVALLVSAGIVYMKRSAGEQKTLDMTTSAAQSRQVAVPDTTTEPGTVPQTPDTVQPAALPDTLLGKDKRDPYEAGNEDGYAAGCDDGAAGHERVSYDETNNFATSAEKQRYAQGYREGYQKGFEDGKLGKQFNIQ